ncbi:MAG: response regulator transcription factor [Methylococcaceae bacterium]|nr:response regulator transcription factor [Methylococcaceae bacterium]
MIRILLLEDHHLMRDGLKRLFEVPIDMDVVGEAANAEELMGQLRQGEPDILLFDMNVPGTHGVDLLLQVRHRYPQIPILILSMHDSAEVAAKALRSGASGYMTKDNDPATLLAAVRKVAAGGRYIEPALAEQLAFQSTLATTAQAHDNLTQREQQILRLFCQGWRINDIAKQLSISNKTVSTHKVRLMEKLQLRSNAEVMRYGLEHGFAE